MKKRQAWTNEENEQLTRIVNDYTAANPAHPLKWERISSELVKCGTNKSSKQCREQSSN